MRWYKPFDNRSNYTNLENLHVEQYMILSPKCPIFLFKLGNRCSKRSNLGLNLFMFLSFFSLYMIWRHLNSN